MTYSKIFTLLLILVSLSSCTISEEVIVNEKGEFDYLQKIDIPQIGAMMNSIDMDDKIQMNQISNNEYSYYEFVQLLQEKGGEKVRNKTKKFDLYQDDLSAIDFFKFRLDLRDKFAIEMINKSKSAEEFNSNSKIIEETFATIKEKDEKRIIDELSQKKRKRKSKQSVEEPLFVDNPLALMTTSSYTYDGKSFSKTIDAEKFSKDFKEQSFDNDQERANYLGMLKQIKFKYKYTFPRKIKSLSIPDAMFTSDGKTFIKEYTLDEIINNPSLGNFKVELED
ncbi:hypothetical protein [Empedobacter brevis]|uniref:hypothetical protein n=1 Tax=Empedobacter brevis TaxID=247 RepID=UPI0039AEF44F